jgi:hypothetical protein
VYYFAVRTSSKALKKGGTGERAQTGVILEIIFFTTTCVKICLLEKKGDAEGSGLQGSAGQCE